MLSAHKKLIAEKLAEEEAERKIKGDAKKEKILVIQSKKPFKRSKICVYVCLYLFNCHPFPT